MLPNKYLGEPRIIPWDVRCKTVGSDMILDLERLKSIIKAVDLYLAERDEVRERAIRLTREIIKSSGWAVTAVHKGDFNEAEEHLSVASEKSKELLFITREYPELYYSGMVYNAISEYVEAKVFIDLVRGRGLEGPDELGVQPVPYLQGLADVVGELKRLALEMVRRGDFESAWKMHAAMEAIYLELRGLDYPDALLPGLRRKTDVARRLVDETKAILTDLESRYKLISRLDEAAKKLK